MNAKDNIYGNFKITEPVIEELFKCKDLTRLKYISQSGLKEFNTYSGVRYSRWEHSVGVMLLLRKLNASLEEQITGLLHDSSHTAFSHVIDFVFNTHKYENYAGENLREFLENSEIGKILNKYGLDVKSIADYEIHKRFKLLERPIPELCADRIDNGLRYMFYKGTNTNICVDNLIVKSNRIVFKSRQAAKKLAEGYLNGTKSDWGNAETGLRAYFLSNAIKLGLEKGIVDIKQFYIESEKSIIKRMKASKDKQILENLRKVDGKLNFVFDRNGNIHVREKVRYVDPIFINDGKLSKLTKVDTKYKNAIYEENKILRKGYKIQLITK
jgi:hypothetical protein